MYHYKQMWTTKKSLMLIVLLFTVFINVGCSTSLNYKVDVDMNGFLQTTEPIGIYDVSFKEKYINGSNSASSYHFEAKLKKNTNSPYSGKAVVVIQYYDKKGNLVDEQSYETEYSMREGDTSIISENFWDKFQAKRLKINDTVIYSAKIISVTERDATEDDKIVEQQQKELEKQVAELKEEEQKKKTEEAESKTQSQAQTQQSSQSASNSSKSNQTQQQSSNNSTTDSSKLEAAKKRLDSTHDGYAYTIKYSSKVYGHTDSSGIYEKFGLVTDSGAPLHLEAAPKDNNNLMQWTEKDFIQAVLPMADTSMIQDYKTVDHGSYQEIRATVQTENMSKYFRVIDSTNGGIRVLAEVEVFSDTPEKDKYDLLASLDSITMK